MSRLKRCPCGEIPQSLGITDTLSGKWILITPDCCGEWTIEARNSYCIDDERDDNAAIAWNDAPRAECLKADNSEEG